MNESNFYVILSGIDGYRINDTAVTHITIPADSEEQAIKTAKTIIVKEDHKYIWKAVTLDEYTSDYL